MSYTWTILLKPFLSLRLYRSSIKSFNIIEIQNNKIRIALCLDDH